VRAEFAALGSVPKVNICHVSVNILTTLGRVGGGGWVSADSCAPAGGGSVAARLGCGPQNRRAGASSSAQDHSGNLPTVYTETNSSIARHQILIEWSSKVGPCQGSKVYHFPFREGRLF